MLNSKISLSLTCLLWFVTAAIAQAQTSRAASAASYVKRGNTWAAKGELDRATVDYDLAIATDPGQVAAFYYRGGARWAKGDLEGATADYTTALALNPRLVEAYNDRGSVRFLQGDIEGAITDLDSARSTHPGGQRAPLGFAMKVAH